MSSKKVSKQFLLLASRLTLAEDNIDASLTLLIMLCKNENIFQVITVTYAINVIKIDMLVGIEDDGLIIVVKKRFSIIIPVLHETGEINELIDHLRDLEGAEASEVIVVDGSAEGDTLKAITAPNVCRLASPPGRARQMNAGAAAAAGDVLIFLHADTRLPAAALSLIGETLKESTYIGGAFDLGIRSSRLRYRLIAKMASLRSRLTRIPYGDQAIFIRKDAFQRLGGYPDLPILEEVALMRRIKKEGGKIKIIPRCALTSPRRWEREGVLYTTLRNWLLILAYCLGIAPERLARFYRSSHRSKGN